MKNKKGLTLIELMVAVGLFSIILVFIYNMMISGNKTWSRESNSIDNQQYARNTMNRLILAMHKSDYFKVESNSSILAFYVESIDYVRARANVRIERYYLSGNEIRKGSYSTPVITSIYSLKSNTGVPVYSIADNKYGRIDFDSILILSESGHSVFVEAVNKFELSTTGQYTNIVIEIQKNEKSKPIMLQNNIYYRNK